MRHMFHFCGHKLEVKNVMTQLTILVSGATGFVGSQLVAHLSAHYPQVQVRALTRTPESDTARHFAALPGVTVVRGNYGDVRSLEAAAEGADRAYVACNNVAEQHRFECNFIDACKGKGVRRIAKISTFRYFCRANGPGHGAAHYHIEQHLHHSGVDHVILHPAYYFQSLLYFTHPIKTAGILPQLLGDMQLNMVDCRDVAQCAAALLTYNDETFAPFNSHHVEIAGPEKLGGEDWAAALRQAGIVVRYEKVAPDAFKQGLRSVGVPEDMATNITAFHTCFYDGSAQIADHATTPGLEGLPGMPVRWRRFEAFVTEVGPMFQSAR
jgi:uncharacterized protein YbjT (DUF2867 family)